LFDIAGEDFELVGSINFMSNLFFNVFANYVYTQILNDYFNIILGTKCLNLSINLIFNNEISSRYHMYLDLRFYTRSQDSKYYHTLQSY